MAEIDRVENQQNAAIEIKSETKRRTILETLMLLVGFELAFWFLVALVGVGLGWRLI